MVWGLCVLVLAAPLTVNAFGSPFRAAFHVLAFGLGLTALLSTWRGAPFFDIRARAVVLLLALWIYLIARAPASLDRPAALLQILDRSALVVVMVILGSGIVGEGGRRVVAAGVVGMALVAAWGILQPFGIHPFMDPALWEPSRPTRPLGTHNLMGGFMIAWLPVAVAGALEASGWRRAGWGGAALLGLGCFLLSESRGAWLAAGVTALIFAPWLARGGARRIAAVVRRDRAGLKLLAVAGLAVVVASAGTVASRLATREHSGVLGEPSAKFASGVSKEGNEAPSEDPSGKGSRDAAPAASQLTSFERRALVGQTALDLVRKRPLWGSGPGSFRLAFYTAAPEAMQRLEAETGETAVHAHWDALEVAAELGLVGLALAAVWLWAVARIALQLLGSSELRLAEVGWVAGGMALGLHALVDFTMQEVPTALAGAVLAGSVMGMGVVERTGANRVAPSQSGASQTAARRRAVRVGRAVAATALVAGIGGALATEGAAAAHRKAYTVLEAGDLEGSEVWLRRAIRLGPDQARDWVALAEVARHRARLAERPEDRRNALVQAAERFEVAARLEPQIAARWIRAAVALEEAQAAGAVVKAEDIAVSLERARTANPYEIEAQTGLAAIARRNGDLVRAAAMLAAGEERAPGDPRLAVERGRLALAQGEGEAAVAAFVAAVQDGSLPNVDPAVTAACDGLAALATGSENGEESGIRVAEKARGALLALASGSGRGAAEAARRLGDLALGAGDRAQAQRWYQNALAQSAAQGPSPELELGLGNLAYAEGAWIEAERHYRAAHQARPDMAEAIQSLGNLAVAQGDTALGRRLYERALVLRPDNAVLRAYVARLDGER